MVVGEQAVLISGAAGGLGGMLAERWAGQGADLLLLDKDERGLERISDRICAAGRKEPGICALDLSDAGADAYANLVEILKNEYGGLHHLVHCAADFRGLAPLDQVSPPEWHDCLQVNLNAAWMLTVSCLPLLKSTDKASITFIVEDTALSGKAYWGAYGVSKTALDSLASMFREELEGSGIRVLSIYPGPMRTSLRARAYFAEDPGPLAEPGVAAEDIIRQIDDSLT